MYLHFLFLRHTENCLQVKLLKIMPVLHWFPQLYESKSDILNKYYSIEYHIVFQIEI